MERGEGQGDWKWVQALLYDVDGKRNGVGIVLDGELKKSVLAVNRESGRIMWMKIEICEVMVNLISIYVPQAGCDEEEKDRFWEQRGGHDGEDPTGRRWRSKWPCGG